MRGQIRIPLLMSAKLSKRKLLLVAGFALGAMGIILLSKISLKDFGGLSGLIGIMLASIGLLIGGWQILLSQETSHDAKEAAITASLTAIKKESDDRDRLHEQQLSDMKARLEAIAAHLDQHQQSLGHDGSLTHILNIKDHLSELKAVVAVLSRQGEVIAKLTRLERDIQALKQAKK